MKLELTLEEANLVMVALGKLPYEAVFQLAEKIKAQAQEQLSQSKGE